MTYISPELDLKSLHCPHCGVLAEQTWSKKIHCQYQQKQPNGALSNQNFFLSGTAVALCKHCENFSLWLVDKMVYPISGNIELPNNDLSAEIQKDYNEARDIFNISPRGAAALLRLAIQKLCVELGEKGKNINNDIASLVKKGLPQSMQKALDSVRVVGNNAVHPGVIDFEDDKETAFALFGFVNIICEVLISQPKRIDEFYTKKVPAKDRENIDKRDNK